MTTSVQIYDRLASRYDRAHQRWLRHAGGPAQAAIDGALAMCLRPGLRVLDAGCGSGAVARRIVEDLDKDVRLTVIDPSAAMMAQAANLPGRRLICGIENAPFEEASFDLVLCCWALEASADPAHSLRKLLGLLAPGGTLLLVFCAERRAGGLTSWLMARHVRLIGAGRFLCANWVRRQIERTRRVKVREIRCEGPAAAFVVQAPAERLLAA